MRDGQITALVIQGPGKGERLDWELGVNGGCEGGWVVVWGKSPRYVVFLVSLTTKQQDLIKAEEWRGKGAR